MKNKSPNEDFILIQKAKNGDKKAFEIVMTKYYPRVHSALYAFTKSYEDAEDLTQQAFIKSWTALESFRACGPQRRSTSFRRVIETLRFRALAFSLSKQQG